MHCAAPSPKCLLPLSKVDSHWEAGKRLMFIQVDRSLTPDSLREHRIPLQFFRRVKICFLLLVAFQLASRTSMAQAPQPLPPDYSANPKWFPGVLTPYKQRQIPPPDLNNSKGLS